MTSPNHPEGSSNMVEREAIARIIDPYNADDGSHASYMAWQVALEKADKVLALVHPTQPVGELEGLREAAWRDGYRVGFSAAKHPFHHPPVDQALADSEHGPIERRARQLYSDETHIDPVIHSNRFPAWWELGDAQKDEYRARAALASPPTNVEGRSRG